MKPISRPGFTMIELLVIVSFIVMFSGYSISYYHQFTEGKKLENASKKISTILDLVRVKSTSGDSSMCTGGSGVTPMLNYYSFEVVDSTSYRMRPYCAEGTPKPVTYSTERNIEFPTRPPPAAPFAVVTFFPVTGGSSCSYVYIKNTSLNKCRFVKTSTTGLVQEDACGSCATCPTGCP